MRKVVFTSLVLIVVLSFPLGGYAAPVFVNDLAFIENRPADDIFGLTGLKLQLDVAATDSGGTGALTGAGAKTQATSSNGTFPFAQPVIIPLNSFFSLTGVEFTANLPLSGAADFSKVTGTYNFSVTNTSAQTTSDTSHNLDKPEIVPIPTGLHTSNSSTTPVFSFTDPNPTPGVNGLIRLYDTFIQDGVTKDVIFQFGTSATPSFLVPSGLLLPGHPYFFRAFSDDIDTTEPVSTIHPRLENRASEYLSFTPVPEPSSLFLLGSGLAALASVVWRRHPRR